MEPPLIPRRRWFGVRVARPYVYAKILNAAKQWTTAKVWVGARGTFDVGKLTYHVDNESVYLERVKERVFWFLPVPHRWVWRPIAYYVEGDPRPIRFLLSPPSVVNAEVYQAALNTKVIMDALNPTNPWILVLILVLSGVSALLSVYLAFRPAVK